MTVGILAFGSLVDEPGDELERSIGRRIDDVTTPFRVEFARSSRSRGGGPTLVPVTTGGAPVLAALLVLKDDIEEAAAEDLLYRRETSDQEPRDASSPRPKWIRAIRDFAGLDVCLYTALRANIRAPAPESLAVLAVSSAAGHAGETRRDGISYLNAQRRRGISTPLAGPYTQAVLAATGARDLDEAWEIVRGSPERFMSIHR